MDAACQPAWANDLDGLPGFDGQPVSCAWTNDPGSHGIRAGRR